MNIIMVSENKLFTSNHKCKVKKSQISHILTHIFTNDKTDVKKYCKYGKIQKKHIFYAILCSFHNNSLTYDDKFINIYV